MLQEFYVNLIKIKTPEPIAIKLAKSYLKWNIIQWDEEIFLSALSYMEKYKISLWDSAIIAAAKKAGTKYILSEDFQHNRIYDGIKIINPFI